MVRAKSQAQLFHTSPKGAPNIVVNDRVMVRTEDEIRVVTVDGIVVHHYRVGDHMAEAYAMVLVVDSAYADQNDVATAFGCSARTLRRYQARFEAGGLSSLGRPRGRPTDTRPVAKFADVRDRAMLRWKAKGLSNREVGHKLSLSEKAIRKRLKRLGYNESFRQSGLFPSTSTTTVPSSGDRSDAEDVRRMPPTAVDDEARPSGIGNPLDRTSDRVLAALGLLDDAAPIFARAGSVSGAGVLLAIPAIEQSGVVSVAVEVYGHIGPAFYGLRTSIVILILLALLRIKRPEALKEHAPIDLGRLFGLDRAPEVKTLRRKLTRLALLEGAERLGRELAQRRVAARGQVMGFLYIDGHVRVYHGEHAIPKTHVTRMRTAVSGTTDYWVNDAKGDPIFVVTAEANTWMTKMLPPLLEEVRTLLGPGRRATIVFDRAGWSPELFLKLIESGFDILTYRKHFKSNLPEKRFRLQKATFEGRLVEYRIHGEDVHLLNGTLRLRQVVRLTDDGRQVAILASDTKLSDVEIVYRMLERWRQENFFKYVREEYAIDALADHRVEPADPSREVPNPAWRAADKELRAARAALAKLEMAYGRAVIRNLKTRPATMRAITSADAKLEENIRVAQSIVTSSKEKRSTIPQRISVNKAMGERPVVKLASERKHLMNILKMVAYQVESDLLELVRPKYARSEHEGRTLVQTALRSAAAIEPTASQLLIKLAPLSSPHRSRAVAALCEALNASNTVFPGTHLRMRYSVSEPPA
jgi:transposase